MVRCDDKVITNHLTAICIVQSRLVVIFFNYWVKKFQHQLQGGAAAAPGDSQEAASNIPATHSATSHAAGSQT